MHRPGNVGGEADAVDDCICRSREGGEGAKGGTDVCDVEEGEQIGREVRSECNKAGNEVVAA